MVFGVIPKEHSFLMWLRSWERPIPPATEAELTGGKKRKRPDFTCNILDRYAVCTEEFEIMFHIECKCLGALRSPSWNFNQNYVEKGIKRFDCTAHEYGKRAVSGMMVGYIISMAPAEILDEVNSYQTRHCSHNPAIECELVEEKVGQYRQQLTRKNTQPEVFKLTHLWVDLTNIQTCVS